MVQNIGIGSDGALEWRGEKKMHRKMCINAHFSVQRSIYPDVETTAQDFFNGLRF